MRNWRVAHIEKRYYRLLKLQSKSLSKDDPPVPKELGKREMKKLLELAKKSVPKKRHSPGPPINKKRGK
jgi:hypothetical protein